MANGCRWPSRPCWASGMVGLTVAKRHDLLEAAEALGVLPRGRTRRLPSRSGRDRRRHQRHHRWAHRRHRRLGVHLRHLVVPASCSRSCSTSPTIRTPPAQPRSARARDPGRSPEGRPDPVEISSTRFPEIGEVDSKLIELAKRARRCHPDQRLQPKSCGGAAGPSRAQRQPAGERGQAGVPARRGAPRPGHPGGQGGRARGWRSSTTGR